jgi:pimeloyl-ACP methyl ester carboxylesterase
LGQFEVSYLATPPSSPGGDFPNYTVTAPTSGPDAAGNYVFLALLWAPAAMPKLPLVTLAVTTTQQGQSATSQASIALEPPPLLLIHGIWSSAAGAGFSSGSQGFYDWMISGRYPHNLIYPVDYSVTVGATNLNSQAFSNADIQCILLSNVTDALAGAAAVGMAARTVDVVAHSMGGLVTRYFMSKGPPGCSLSGAALLPSPVHRLITIGTPHQGSQLATTLWNNQHLLSWFALGEILADPELAWFCLPVAASCTQRGLCMPSSACTLGGAMSDLGRPVDTGVLSLEPDSPEIQALLPSNEFTAIVGEAPSPLSPTEFLLDLLISAFLPGQSVLSILGYQPNDTIVPVSSQSPQSSGQTGSATVPGIVHGGICCGDVDETHSTVVWAQAYNWLTGGSGTVPGASPSNVGLRPFTTTSSVSQPILNLSGYTQVPASNVTFLPVTGSTLTINSATNITASSTKTISEVLLFQNVADPTDTALLYAMQSPFTIPFTPTRLGTANFGAIAVFNDNTYAMATLNYTLQPGDTPYALNLLNAPLASMSVGDSRVVQASALSPSGQINVTQVATYTARSGSASVFSVSAGGTITANGNGVDFLDVSYGGVTATAQIPVGPCTYALNPANQIVPSTGGTATIQVTTQSGCAWTATGGASWLPFSQAGGSGSGSITLTAAANSSGGTQGAIVSLAGLQAIVTQPSTACSYNLSQTQINAPAAGASGTITATTSCPVIASSNQTWVTAMPLGSSVQYTVAPNNGTSQRSATLTIGSVGVPVTQAALNLCDLQRNGSIGVADVQLIIDQALGLTPTVNDLNVDGVVNVVDLQIESNAALGPGCAAQ